MFEAWKIGVILNASSNAARVFQQTGAAAAAANKQINAQQGALANATAGVSKYSGAINAAKVGLEVMGVAAAATFAIGIKGAANLQQSLAQLSVQTGRTVADLDATFTKLSMAGSNRTGMSLHDAFNVTREVSGVIKDRAELQRVMGAGGMLDFVTVLRKSGVSQSSPESIARNVITIDHILNAYREKEMAHVQDRLYRAAVGSHMDLGSLTTQVGYFGEQFRLASGNRKGAVDDIMTLAQLGYWGIGHGKWGSGFGQILRTVNRPTKAALGALTQLGIFDADGKLSSTTQNEYGEFTPMAMIAKAIERTYGRHMAPMAIQQLLNQALPANAARVMAEAMSPKTTAFVQRLHDQQRSMPSLMDAEGLLMGNLNDQTSRLIENFKNLATMLERPFQGPLARFVGGLADRAGGAAEFFRTHTGAARIAGAAVAGLGVAGIGMIARTLVPYLHFGINPATGHAHLGANTYSRTFGAKLPIGKMIGDAGEILGKVVGGFMRFGLEASRLGSLWRMITGSGAMQIFTHGLGQWHGALTGLLPTMLKVGLRFLNVVGWVSLAIDALRFFHDHPKDIGVWIGKVIVLFRDTLLPGIGSVLMNVGKTLVSWIGDMLRDVFWVLMHPISSLKVGFGDAGKLLSGILKEIDPQGYQAANQRAYEQNRAEQRSRDWDGSEDRSHRAIIHLSPTIVLPHGTPEQHAKKVAKLLGREFAYAVRQGGDQPHDDARVSRLSRGGLTPMTA